MTPTPVNPLGAKGVGEAGTIGSTPAIVNAVVDALAPFGVDHIDMMLRPEKLWRIMQGGRAVIPDEFDYARPRSLARGACSFSPQHGDDAKMLAGGHSLIPLMKLRLAAPGILVDLGRVA